MTMNFTNFTAEAMRAFGQDLADGLQRRSELLNNARDHTSTMLASFRKERRERASRNADARQLSMSELKSDVHSLLGRFELNRKEMARELKDMSHQCQAASDAFRSRPGAPRRGGPQPKQTPSSASAQPFRATAESHDGPKPPPSASAQPPRAAAESRDSPMARQGPEDKPGDSKKRHT
jgi:hypothetical protein